MKSSLNQDTQELHFSFQGKKIQIISPMLEEPSSSVSVHYRSPLKQGLLRTFKFKNVQA